MNPNESFIRLSVSGFPRHESISCDSMHTFFLAQQSPADYFKVRARFYDYTLGLKIKRAYPYNGGFKFWAVIETASEQTFAYYTVTGFIRQLALPAPSLVS